MGLEKSLQQQYGRSAYRHTFSSDFKEAIKSMDSITRIVTKAVKKKEKNKES